MRDSETTMSTPEAVCPGKKDDPKVKLVQLQEQLAGLSGLEGDDAPEYWRSLEELAGSAEFRENMHREFPKGTSEWLDDVSRRGFMKLMGASVALAGLTACTRQPTEYIVPYVRQPEELIPGRPLYFASAMTLGGYANPVLVEAHEYRPTHLEGNPDHPASLGGISSFAQASLLDMYDPDRAQFISYLGQQRSWNAFTTEMRGLMSAQKALKGAGLRFLTQTVSSPTLAAQIKALIEQYPEAKWHAWEPGNRDNVYAGAQMAFGQPVETQYHFDKADVILSLDGDFLSADFPGFTRYARDFAKNRNPEEKMNRLYVVESGATPTGMKADHRLPVLASEIEGHARAVAAALGVAGVATGTVSPEHVRFATALIADLKASHGAAVAVTGDHQPAIVHALVHAINGALGAVGNTVTYTDPVPFSPLNQTGSIYELSRDIKDGKVDALFVLGGNPVFDAPADMDFEGMFKGERVPLRVYLGTHSNETAVLCQWHINEAHFLEAWSDARAYDGTVSVVQPLIEPLYDGRSAHELLAALMGTAGFTGPELIKFHWLKEKTGKVGAPGDTVPADFEASWRKSLHDGLVAGSASAPKALAVKAAFPASVAAEAVSADSVEVNLRRDPCLYDGRFANNGWLQELPAPMTKLTWDNAVIMGPALATRLGLETGDVVSIESDGRYATGATWIQAGHADKSVTLNFGYGRERAGRTGTGSGFNVYPLRTHDTQWTIRGAKLVKKGDTFRLATTQGQQSIETPVGDRPLVREANLAEYKKNPGFAGELSEAPSRDLTLYQNVEYKDRSWGMVIDLNACIGCNGCVIACQSENNIAVVGKDQVLRGRYMHWIRVDTYYQGDRNNPKALYQPVPCQQCENAPCEQVCPVGATVHSTEGLNDMVYNRCIGTRYCSNNCPYKVRRFNFLRFQDLDTTQYKMMRNPNVTIRTRGVMEKCTYCVQRINQSRIDAEREDRQIADGTLQTACQQGCPTNAIVFGDINDKNSRVAKLKANERNYGMLADLNTRPRTTYLAAVRNPNPELAESGGQAERS